MADLSPAGFALLALRCNACGAKAPTPVAGLFFPLRSFSSLGAHRLHISRRRYISLIHPQTVWEYDPAVVPQTHTVAFHVSQLRKKLQPIAHRIVTLKHAGYRFVLEEGELSAQGAGKLT